MVKKNISSKVRCFNHRKRILEISQNVKALHIGGSFSSVEILDTIFFNLLKKMINLFYQRAIVEYCYIYCLKQKIN